MLHKVAEQGGKYFLNIFSKYIYLYSSYWFYLQFNLKISMLLHPSFSVLFKRGEVSMYLDLTFAIADQVCNTDNFYILSH
jgi:hypothetical protein